MSIENLIKQKIIVIPHQKFNKEKSSNSISTFTRINQSELINDAQVNLFLFLMSMPNFVGSMGSWNQWVCGYMLSEVFETAINPWIK